MLRDRLLGAIREVYDSATDATLWPGCLTSIGRLLGGTSTNLLYHDHRSKGAIQIAIGADSELYRLYNDFGYAIDPWALAFQPGSVPAGHVVIGASVVDYAPVGRRLVAYGLRSSGGVQVPTRWEEGLGAHQIALPLSGTPNPSSAGQNVQFTAVVVTSTGAIATGQVTSKRATRRWRLRR